MITLVKNTVEGKNKPEHLKLISREELLRRYIKFYEVIAGRPTYVSLLLQYPLAAKRLGDVLGSGKWAAEYLNRHPLLLDETLGERLSQNRRLHAGWISLSISSVRVRDLRIFRKTIRKPV